MRVVHPWLAAGTMFLVLPSYSTLAETMELLERQLECGICLETFQDPKALRCLHAYCRKCIQMLVENKENEVKCPQCRKTFAVEDNNPDSLPTVLFINELIEIYNKVKLVVLADQSCSSDKKENSLEQAVGQSSWYTRLKAFFAYEPESQAQRESRIKKSLKGNIILIF